MPTLPVASTAPRLKFNRRGEARYVCRECGGVSFRKPYKPGSLLVKRCTYPHRSEKRACRGRLEYREG